MPAGGTKSTEALKRAVDLGAIRRPVRPPTDRLHTMLTPEQWCFNISHQRRAAIGLEGARLTVLAM